MIRRMEPIPQLLLRTLISFGLFSFVANENCDEGGYKLLSNPRRSAQATYVHGVDNPLCDSKITAGIWYRFSSYSGDEIVERAANDPVPTQRCGTDIPIYIRGLGSHPVADNATTNATVCANYGGTDTCNWMDTIQIHRCSVQGYPSYFYLYRLKSPPGCSLSYCVGERNVCNRGERWNGFSCVNYFPAMKAFPVFSGPHINGSGLSAEIYFSCEVQYDRQPNDINISCQAESMWDGYSDFNSSLGSVAKYHAAFKSTVQSYNIRVTKESTSNVTFQSTLPLTCRHCATATTPCSCEYLFRLVNYTAYSAQCFLVWSGGTTAAIPVYFEPTATLVGDSFALVFEKYNDDELSARGKSLWRDYVIPPVSMIIVSQTTSTTSYKTCASFADPHIVTFDCHKYFDNLMVGDFYLARAINANQFMEIQVRHEICNGRASCNCGIIVREGNSAFKISTCEAGSWSAYGQRSPTVVRLLSQDPADSSTVYMDGTGRKFSIRMPSGLRVEVAVQATWFNVEVHLPQEYHGKTDSTSMCGNSNGNCNDDFRTNPRQFRIPDNLSYFRRQPDCSSTFNKAAKRCGCNGTHPICYNTGPVLQAMSGSNEPFSGYYSTRVVCQRSSQRSRRDADTSSLSDKDSILDEDTVYPPYTYDPTFGENVTFTWPTPKGKTKQEVEQHCSNMLQSSPAYDDCSANVDVYVTAIIEMCASDIQIADDWISVSAYANVFQRICLNSLAAAIKVHSDSTHVALMRVYGKLCPNNCTGHGTCSEATCTCNTGYIGADCSIDQSQPPFLIGIIRGGVCDVRVRPCDVISVYGSGVAFSSRMKCRFRDPNTGVDVETEGKFISAGEYSCLVPETTTHRRRRSATTRTTALSSSKVSITIDGVLYSNALDFVLFDSLCMECNSSDSCRQQENSCLLNGECFANAAVNPDDPCLQCVPSVNRNLWSNRTVVEDWSPCRPNGDCETGVTTRSTVCGSTIINEEVKSCKVLDCPRGGAVKSSLFCLFSFEGILRSSLSHIVLTLALQIFLCH